MERFLFFRIFKFYTFCRFLLFENFIVKKNTVFSTYHFWHCFHYSIKIKIYSFSCTYVAQTQYIIHFKHWKDKRQNLICIKLCIARILQNILCFPFVWTFYLLQFWRAKNNWILDVDVRCWSHIINVNNKCDIQLLE